MRTSYLSPGCLLFAAALSLSGCQEGTGPMVKQGEVLNSDQVSLDAPKLFPRDLGSLGRVFTVPSDINNVGTVVGNSERADGAIHAFRWTKSTGMIDLGTLPGDRFSTAFTVTDDDRVFGISGNTAVMWTAAGEIRPLDIPLLPGSTYNRPVDANALGQVVGTTDGGPSFTRAWIWSESEGISEIGGGAPVFGTLPAAINDVGLVVGLAGFPIIHAFSWSRATGMVDLGPPESPRSQAWDVNALGDIVGNSFRGPSSALLRRPRFWNREGKVRSLQAPEGGEGQAQGINSGGDAVGWVRDRNAQHAEATVWWSGSGGRAVRLLPLREGSSGAVGINDQRSVIGTLLTGGLEIHAVLWQPAPDTSPISESAVHTTPVSVPAQVVSGPAACYTDPSVVTKQALVRCFVRYIRSGGPGSD